MQQNVNMTPCGVSWRRGILLQLILLISVAPIRCFDQQSYKTVSTERSVIPVRHPVNNRQLRQNAENSTVTLKVCGGVRDNYGDKVFIPTFIPTQLSYILKEYKLEKSFGKHCGDETNASLVTIMTINDFDKKVFPKNQNNSVIDLAVIFELLRTKSFVFPNGYLSKGDEINRRAKYRSSEEFCISAIRNRENNKNAAFDFLACPFAPSRPQLPKCCPLGMMVEDKTCKGYSSKGKWDPGYLDHKTKKRLSIGKANPVYTLSPSPCNQHNKEHWESDQCNKEFHPMTDNSMVFIAEDRRWKTLNITGTWCIDSRIHQGKKQSSQRLTLFFCRSNERHEENPDRLPARISRIYMIAMYIGAVFHLLTTTAHIIIWKKLTIYGKTLCSCTASLFFMHIFWATFHLMGLLDKPENMHSHLCVGNSIGGQYFTIAAFTWLMIVNFDLWRTYRTVSIKKDGKFRRFLVYSILGWGFPLLVSIISISLEITYSCRVTQVRIPDFGDHYCFIAPWAQGPYLYYILSVLMVLSFMFSALTMLSLCRISNHAGELNPEEKTSRYKMMFFFLKLGMIMGLSWVLEVIGWLVRANQFHPIWTVIDLYNSLSAILIFIVFVCNQATFEMLEETIPQLKGVREGFCKLRCRK